MGGELLVALPHCEGVSTLTRAESEHSAGFLALAIVTKVHNTIRQESGRSVVATGKHAAIPRGGG